MLAADSSVHAAKHYYSKKLENHAPALYFMFYHFVRGHKTPHISPAMGLASLKRSGRWKTLRSALRRARLSPRLGGRTRSGRRAMGLRLPINFRLAEVWVPLVIGAIGGFCKDHFVSLVGGAAVAAAVIVWIHRKFILDLWAQNYRVSWRKSGLIVLVIGSWLMAVLATTVLAAVTYFPAYWISPISN